MLLLKWLLRRRTTRVFERTGCPTATLIDPSAAMLMTLPRQTWPGMLL